MRILILTLHLDRNYGGILQCYALQTVLKRMGHDVKVLSKPIYDLEYYMKYPLAICKRILKKYILGQNIEILRSPFQIVKQNINRFIENNIDYLYINNWESIDKKIVDIIVVGSDQVWRPKYFSPMPVEYAFCSFLKDLNVKKISYSASFGVDICEYTKEQLKVCSSLLKNFDAVSVREDSGVNICKRYFGVDAVNMLDPTLLLSVDDYRSLIKKSKTESVAGNMLVYLLDETEEKIRIVNKIAIEKGLKPFYINVDTEDERIPLEGRIKISVEQWLRSFDEADFVFTDSFHGCVFSIIFNKQFIVYGNRDRGLTRFESLFGQLQLNYRIIFSENEYNENSDFINENIDFEKLNSILCDKRLIAFEYLHSCISVV